MNTDKSFAIIVIIVFISASCVIIAIPVGGTTPDGAMNSWVEKAPMQVARDNLGVVALNGKIYAIGGSIENGTNPNTIGTNYNANGWIVGTNEEYDPSTNTWTLKAPMPTPRYSFAIAAYNNKIYCIGGITAYKVPNANFTVVNEVYDLATNKWETKTSMPTTASNVEANVVNGKIYVLAGTINYIYDPNSDTWSTKSPMPTPMVSGYPSVIFDDKIYAIGSKIEIYNPETDNWSLGGTPPKGLSGVAVATTGIMAPKRIYVFSNYNDPIEVMPSNQIYDPANNSWTVGADLVTNRNAYSVAVINDTLYAIGGTIIDYLIPSEALYTAKPSAVNEAYTPLGYGTPDPSYVLETTPPKISVLSPLTQTYNDSSVPLISTVDKSVNWTGYSFDGKDNVTFVGNTTLTGLPNGLHNITVYAQDSFGNVGASETVTFTVAVRESFPTVEVVTISVFVAAVVCVGVLFYLRKRKV